MGLRDWEQVSPTSPNSQISAKGHRLSPVFQTRHPCRLSKSTDNLCTLPLHPLFTCNLTLPLALLQHHTTTPPRSQPTPRNFSLRHTVLEALLPLQRGVYPPHVYLVGRWRQLSSVHLYPRFRMSFPLRRVNASLLSKSTTMAGICVQIEGVNGEWSPVNAWSAHPLISLTLAGETCRG